MNQRTTSWNRSFHRHAITILIAVLCFCGANESQAVKAQFLAWPPGEQDQGIKNCAHEDCHLWFSVAPTGQYDADANPTEAWIAQPEIQKSLDQLIAAIEKFAKKNASDSAAGTLLFSQRPSDFLKQPMAVMWSAPNPADVDKTGAGAFVMKLDALEKRASELLAAIAAENVRNFEIRRVAGADCYFFKPIGGQLPTAAGIIDNYLIVAMGNQSIDAVVDNMKTPPAKWMADLEKRTAIDRPAMTAYVDINAWVALTDGLTGDDLRQWQGLDDIFRFSQFETLQYQNGMTQDGFSELAYLDHQQPLEGLLSALSTTPYTGDQGDGLSEIPSDVGTVNAIKLAPQQILNLLKQTYALNLDNSSREYENFTQKINAELGVDFEKDIVASLEGGLWVYGEKSLTSPKIVAAVKLADKEKFQRLIDSVIEKADNDVNWNIDQEQKSGNTFYTFSPPTGLSISGAIVDDTFYLCNSSRGIASHVRKKKRASGKLASTPRFKKLLAEASSKNGQGLIGVSELDLAALFEIGFPIARVALGPYMDREVFDFTMDDIPEVGVLLNGLRPNTTVLFRTDTGLAMRSIHDFPIGLEATTGIAIGMLLPAVQQVRAAARRATSLNNQRQLGLAIHNYASKYGHLPPAYTVDKQGNRLLSWRVHMLPFLDQRELYEQFKLDQPWDSPHNIQLANQMPALFEHPGVSVADHHTVYVAPVNQNSAISDGPINEQGHGIDFKQITDGLSNTWLLLEANQSRSVVWTSPEDLRIDDLEDEELIEAITGFMSRSSVVMCDGSTRNHFLEELGDDGVGLRGSMKVSDGNFLQHSR